MAHTRLVWAIGCWSDVGIAACDGPRSSSVLVDRGVRLDRLTPSCRSSGHSATPRPPARTRGAELEPLPEAMPPAPVNAAPSGVAPTLAFCASATSPRVTEMPSTATSAKLSSAGSSGSATSGGSATWPRSGLPLRRPRALRPRSGLPLRRPRAVRPLSACHSPVSGNFGLGRVCHFAGLGHFGLGRVRDFAGLGHFGLGRVRNLAGLGRLGNQRHCSGPVPRRPQVPPGPQLRTPRALRPRSGPRLRRPRALRPRSGPRLRRPRALRPLGSATSPASGTSVRRVDDSGVLCVQRLLGGLGRFRSLGKVGCLDDSGLVDLPEPRPRAGRVNRIARSRTGHVRSEAERQQTQGNAGIISSCAFLAPSASGRAVLLDFVSDGHTGRTPARNAQSCNPLYADRRQPRGRRHDGARTQSEREARTAPLSRGRVVRRSRTRAGEVQHLTRQRSPLGSVAVGRPARLASLCREPADASMTSAAGLRTSGRLGHRPGSGSYETQRAQLKRAPATARPTKREVPTPNPASMTMTNTFTLRTVPESGSAFPTRVRNSPTTQVEDFHPSCRRVGGQQLIARSCVSRFDTGVRQSSHEQTSRDFEVRRAPTRCGPHRDLGVRPHRAR